MISYSSQWLASLLQVHQGYSDLIKGLLEKLTQDHSISVGITASALTLQSSPQAESHSGRTDGRTCARASHLKLHADLRYAVALLLLAAEGLPDQDVEFSVCRLLFDQASQSFLQLQFAGCLFFFQAIPRFQVRPVSCFAAVMHRLPCFVRQVSCILRAAAYLG